MREVFTLQRQYLRMGLSFLPFFSGMLVFSEWGTFADSRLVWLSIFSGVVWTVMSGLAVWMVFAYYRESVALDGEEVHLTGVFRRLSFSAANVHRARWRRPPSLKLWTTAGRAVIHFDNFRPARRGLLMRHFHDWLPAEVQEGWDDKLERYAAEVADREIAEFRRLRRFIRRGVLWIGLIGMALGAACGLDLALYAASKGVVVPTLSGYLAVDWSAVGLVVVLGVLAFVEGLAWLFRPDEG